jgi:tetratricopeptide (TPR) repeat protein
LGFPLFLVLLFSTAALALPADLSAEASAKAEAMAKEGQHAPHAISSVPQELLERPVTIRTGIGAAHDDAGTKSADAQRFYDQGLAYLHNYVWIEAARSFNQALRSDPNLALAHSGLSVAYIELNKSTESRQAIEKAKTLAARSSDHVKRHVDARALQMAAEEAPADSTKLAAYRKALDSAIAAFPNDAQFLLLRGIAESPDPADRGQGSVAGSIPYYERALKLSVPSAALVSSVPSAALVSSAPSAALVSSAPSAAHHFLAHAYENTGRMKEAADHAAAYASAASSVPHAIHMHGHELRRLGRVTEAIARFEAADKLERDYMAREKISNEYDWHHAHNTDLLAASYQYVGQMKKAEALLKQNFNTPTNLLVQAVNKREYPSFLTARGRPAEALTAAKTLLSHPNLVVQATGHIESAVAQLAMNRPADAAASSNAALRALRSAPGAQGLAAIELEALQGEFNLRTAQRDKGRAMMESAARKWRSLPGPDAWSQSLFRLEALARAARNVGDWTFAARMAQLMLEHDANYAGTHYALALVAQHDGNADTARREFDLAVKAWATADRDLPELAIARRK